MFTRFSKKILNQAGPTTSLSSQAPSIIASRGLLPKQNYGNIAGKEVILPAIQTQGQAKAQNARVWSEPTAVTPNTFIEDKQATLFCQRPVPGQNIDSATKDIRNEIINKYNNENTNNNDSNSTP